MRQFLKNCRSLESIALSDVHDTEKILINPIIIESINQFSKDVETKKLTIKTDIDNTDTTKISGSKILLENSLFNNLIHNAIKFSEENAEIIIRTYKSSQNIYFLVTNKASSQATEGLKKSQKLKLSSTKGTKGEIGSGLGLFIATKICDKYGGYLGFDTKKEANDSFSITARVSLPI